MSSELVNTASDRDDWLRARANGIGGSEAAAALGISPWRSTYSLWAEKTGLIPPDDIGDREAVEWGKILEPVVRNHYAEKTNRHVTVDEEYTILRHPQYPWMLGTLDGYVYDDTYGEGVLEIKTASAYARNDWEFEPPLHYLCQGMHYLAITGLSWISFAVLIGGQAFRTYDIARDDEFIDKLCEAEKYFWCELVGKRIQPQVDGSRQTARVLQELYGKDNGSTVILPEDAVAWDKERERLKAEIEELDERKKRLISDRDKYENQIRQAIGGAAVGELPNGGGSYSWKAHEKNGNIVRQLRRRNP